MHVAALPLAPVVGLLLFACPHLAHAFKVRRSGGALRHNTSGRCLKFMHIPKTGGSSIDSQNLHLPKSKRAFHSQMVPVYDKLSELDPLHRDAGQLFDWAHRSGQTTYKDFLIKNYWAYTWHEMPHDELCHSIHAPPSVDTRLADYYTERGCSTFCVVRDPLHRFISTSAFTVEFNCTPGKAAANFENFVHRALGPFGTFHRDPYQHLCLYLPQVEMVYGAKSKPRAKRQYCHRILRQENLTSEFNLLMREYGSSLNLNGGRPLFSSNGCALRPSDLSRRTKELIYHFYKADYLAFGYPKPYV